MISSIKNRVLDPASRLPITLSYASSKVDCYASSKVGENIYMLASDMNLNIRPGTVRYNNKILVSDGKFSLEKNEKVNAPAMKSTQAATTVLGQLPPGQLPPGQLPPDNYPPNNYPPRTNTPRTITPPPDNRISKT